MAGKYDRYWEMREGGPHGPSREVFKCTDCGAVTYPENGHNGRPDPHRCHKSCKSRQSDWNPGFVTDKYRRNFENIFPDAPGSGL